jgi:hypothetical protein
MTPRKPNRTTTVKWSSRKSTPLTVLCTHLAGTARDWVKRAKKILMHRKAVRTANLADASILEQIGEVHIRLRFGSVSFDSFRWYRSLL